jgi:hypothetical protein
MPQNFYWDYFNPEPIQNPLPTNLIAVDITAPTLIKSGSGVFYGYDLDEGPVIPSIQQLIITADSKIILAWDWGFSVPFPQYYVNNVSGNPYWPWVFAPYGQLRIPFDDELRVESVPEGLNLVLWYT